MRHLQVEPAMVALPYLQNFVLYLSLRVQLDGFDCEGGGGGVK